VDDSGRRALRISRNESWPVLANTRILGFCDYFATGSSGGTERVALEVYQRLALRGADVTVVTIGKSRKPIQKTVNGVKVHEIPLLDLSGVVRAQVAIAPALFRYVPRIVRNLAPNVLHANNIYFQTTLAAALLQHRLALPLVTTAHIGSLSRLSEPIRSLTVGYERTVGRYIMSRSVRVIAVSESVREHLVSLGRTPDKIDLVCNGVDLERFRPPLPSERNGDDSTPAVVFVGRLIGNKGPGILLDALFRLHREGLAFTATFIGDGPLRSLLERRVHESGLATTVKFTGHLPDVAADLRRAVVLVRPSLSEGMPLTVLEAMASHVCVVASDIPGNRDLIRNGENGLLVPTQNVSSLANAIRRVLENRELRRRFVAAGYETSRTYSWDSTASGTAAVLALASNSQRAQT
jgi:glycosyltransferase involved in cell wall biosynthesis